MSRAWCVFLLLSVSTTMVSASQRTDTGFSLPLSQSEWSRVGDPATMPYDVLVKKDGTRLDGELREVPTLSYRFGDISFCADEVAGLATVDKKVEIVTRNGQFFIGTPQRHRLTFWQCDDVGESTAPRRYRSSPTFKEIEIPYHEVDFVVLRSRGNVNLLIDEAFYSIILTNGDRFPVRMVTREIRLSNGWENYSLPVQKIHKVTFRHGRLRGDLRGEAFPEDLPTASVLDSDLSVRLAKDDKALELPWNSIDTIMGDEGSFVATTPYVCPTADTGGDMVLIPKGRFIFGINCTPTAPTLAERISLVKQGSSHITTVHHPLYDRMRRYDAAARCLDMPAFYIDKTEVTNAEYEKFVVATGHEPPTHWIEGRVPRGLENHPVVNVTYEDAAAYATWAEKRLPTEEEWERAAKGASGGLYPYGPTYIPDFGNTEGVGTKPVASYRKLIEKADPPADTFATRLFDMSGNVSEWTSTSFVGNVASGHDTAFQPYREAHRGQYRVVRGGSFVSSALTATTTYRAPMYEHDYNEYTGFRCVKDER